MSDGPGEAGFPAIRMVFQLDRAENPRLYDDLARFRKGARRVNRLRLLAHEGVLAQQLAMASEANVTPQVGQGPSVSGDASVTNGVFEPGIDT